MDFSMVKIGPYFHKSIKGAIWTIFIFFLHQKMFPQNLHGALFIWIPIIPWHMFDQKNTNELQLIIELVLFLDFYGIQKLANSETINFASTLLW